MSKPPKNLLEAIEKWIPIFAEAYHREVKKILFEIWLVALEGMPVDKFEASCAYHLRANRFFPTVADILGNTETSKERRQLTDGADADAAWDHVILYADHWHPDTGAYSDAPILTEREIYAVRAIGGVLAVQENQGGKAMPFLRRDFIEVWKRAIYQSEQPALGADSRPEPKRLMGGFERAFEKPN